VIDQVNLSDIAFTGRHHSGHGVAGDLHHGLPSTSPIVSSFVVSKREEYEPEFGKAFTEQKCSKIIGRASMLMVAVVMFFAFSCLFTLSPQNMADAKAQNIPVLSYLANHFASMSGTKSTFATVLEYGASIIALVAIFKSFFGHYLGTLEGLNGLILKFGYKGDKKKVSVGKLNTISMVFIMGSTWLWPMPTRTFSTLSKPWAHRSSPLCCACCRCTPSAKRQPWRNIRANPRTSSSRLWAC
jgi:threonine transporter